MTRRHWLVLIVLATSIGGAITASLGRQASRIEAPAGWHRLSSRGQVFIQADTVGARPPPWTEWSVSSYESIAIEVSARQFEVQAEIPESGRLLVALAHSQASPGTGVLLEAGAAPTGRRIRADGSTIDASCVGDLSPLSAGDVTVSLARNDSGWSARINGASLNCRSAVGLGGPSVTAGLKRVVLDELSLDGKVQPRPAPGAWLAGLITALSILALGGLERRLRVEPAHSLATWSPLLIGPLGLGVDGAWLAETLRMVSAPGDVLIVGIAVAMALGAKLMLALFMLTRHWAQRKALALVVSILVSGTVGMALAGALGISHPIGLGYSGIAGASAGALMWVQARASQVRGYNVISLLLAIAVLVGIETGVRYSSLGPVWNSVDDQQGAGTMQTLIEQFEDLDRGIHSEYPSSGFPVAVGPKSAATRVACLGASSTGGAYQNDDLREFYPARLSERLGPDVDVINQGVGGWTSFHLRHFLDQHLDRLDADVITIYLGLNETLSTPVPFDTLYNQWRSGALQASPSHLDSVRLFQGLRLLVRGLRPGGGPGVSPESLKENLEHIVTLTRARGIRTLLMNEGIRPDPDEYTAYWVAMKSVADGRDDVAYLDTATLLHRVGMQAFLDGNHLSDTGHRAVAEAMTHKLEALGWVSAP